MSSFSINPDEMDEGSDFDGDFTDEEEETMSETAISPFPDGIFFLSFFLFLHSSNFFSFSSFLSQTKFQVRVSAQKNGPDA